MGERGLQMLSQSPKLMPSPGGTDLMAMAGLLTAMATMERDLLMLSLLQMPSLGGMEAMDMAGPMVSIGDNLTIYLNYLQEKIYPKTLNASDITKMDHGKAKNPHH